MGSNGRKGRHGRDGLLDRVGLVSFSWEKWGGLNAPLLASASTGFVRNSRPHRGRNHGKDSMDRMD